MSTTQVLELAHEYAGGRYGEDGWDSFLESDRIENTGSVEILSQEIDEVLRDVASRAVHPSNHV